MDFSVSQPARKAVDGEDVPAGSEHVLFIDDEKSIIKMAEQQIRSLGYEVTTSNGSIEALELFEKRSGEFGLIITDMTMPHMKGDELAGKLLSIRPDIPVILCTGYNSNITDDRAKGIGVRAVLRKPILKRDLAVKIREVLDNRK